MLRIGFLSALLVSALATSGCEEQADEADSEAGGAEGAGDAGRAPQAGTAGSTAGSQLNAGGTANGAGRGGSSGSAGTNEGGVSGFSGTSSQAASAGVTGGGRATTGGSAGLAGGSGTEQGGSAGRGGGGADAGASGSAGAGGEPPDDPSSCPSPFETLDISKLVTNETLEAYTVTGTTEDAIRQSINANRDGDYDAFTSWYLSWQYADCSGGGLVVTADVTYRMPDWDAPDDAEPGLVVSWQSYESALFCHEYGHAKFGLDAANEIHAALDAIEAEGDCETQQSLAGLAFDRILDDYLTREIQYDADTNHGATMGAIFPLP